MMMGSPTKEGEYYRTIELFEYLFKTQGPYYALAILYDSQYGRDDIKAMMDLIEGNSYLREKYCKIKTE